jgi:hypothetical protein
VILAGVCLIAALLVHHERRLLSRSGLYPPAFVASSSRARTREVRAAVRRGWYQ